LQEAAAYRETLQAIQRGEPVAKVYPTETPWGATINVPTPEELIRDDISDRAAQLNQDVSPAVAGAFYGVATGTATPIKYHLETWLRGGGSRGPIREKTKGEYRSEVTKFAEWLDREKLPGTIEGITRKIAGRYISEFLMPSGLGTATNKKKVTALSS
jgi:hypothetical protein